MRMFLNYYGMIIEVINLCNVIVPWINNVYQMKINFNYSLDLYVIVIGVIYVVFKIK